MKISTTYEQNEMLGNLSNLKVEDKVILRNIDIPEFVMKSSLKNIDDFIIPNIKIEEIKATVYSVTDKKIKFVFDNCICNAPIDLASDTPKWKTSQLRQYLKQNVTKALGLDCKVSLLTYEEVFGDNALEYFKSRKNRICIDLEDCVKWWWLKTLHNASAADFCATHGSGDSSYDGASIAYACVRPRFVIEK